MIRKLLPSHNGVMQLGILVYCPVVCNCRKEKGSLGIFVSHIAALRKERFRLQIFHYREIDCYPLRQFKPLSPLHLKSLCIIPHRERIGILLYICPEGEIGYNNCICAVDALREVPQSAYREEVIFIGRIIVVYEHN